jgi:integrase
VGQAEAKRSATGQRVTGEGVVRWETIGFRRRHLNRPASVIPLIGVGRLGSPRLDRRPAPMSMSCSPGSLRRTLSRHRQQSQVFLLEHRGREAPECRHDWQHDLREVFRAAGMPDGHPHQLRDTFAVGLLEKGVPMEEVSKALGHE